MTRKLRFGVMGTKWVSQRHAEAIVANAGAELTAVAELDDTLRQQFIARFAGKPRGYGDYRDMLTHAQLDAVVVGLPTPLHAPACRAALEAGLHVMCEKPPTCDTAEVVELVRLARRRKLTYMFCRQPRFTSASLQARQLVAAGKLGAVYHAEAKWLRTRYLPEELDNWRVSKRRGGGVLLDLGIHVIDGAWFVMGCPQPVEVAAGMHCRFGHLAPKGQDYSADDCSLGVIRFADGATLQFTCAFSLNWAGLDPKPSRKLVRVDHRELNVFGTLGAVDVMRNQEMVAQRDGVRVRALGAERAPRKSNRALPEFVRQTHDFIQAVRTGAEPTNSPAQAVMLMQMLDAINQSAATGRAVSIRPRKL